MRWVAKCRWKKKTRRSTRGLRVRIIWSHQASTRSVSDSYGRSGVPSRRRGGGPTAGPRGSAIRRSTARCRLMPLKRWRSASEGPKPARHMRRSTIGSVRAAWAPPAAARRVRLRRGATTRPGAHFDRPPHEALEGLRRPPLADPEVAVRVPRVEPDDAAEARDRRPAARPAARSTLALLPPVFVDPVSATQNGFGESADTCAVDVLEQGLGVGPGEAADLAEVVAARAHEIDLVGAGEVGRDGVLGRVRDAAHVGRPHQLDPLAAGVAHHLADLGPGLGVVGRGVLVDRPRPRVPGRVGLGHRAQDRRRLEVAQLLGQADQAAVLAAAADRREAELRLPRAGRLLAAVGHPGDEEARAGALGERHDRGSTSRPPVT